MMPSAFFLLFIGLYLTHLRLVSAKLWPIKPVAGTKYTAGQCGEILWTDDGKHPSMQDMGSVTIDLLFNSTDYIVTVGEYDPLAGSAMFCPPVDLHWPKSANHFTFHFTGKGRSVYTHDFTILNTHSAHSKTSNNSNSPTTLYLPPSPSALPTSASTIQSYLSPTSPNFQRQEPESSTTVYADPLSGSPVPHISNSARSNVNLNMNLKIFSSLGGKQKTSFNMEKIKFNLVFIVWPALIGISMAL